MPAWALQMALGHSTMEMVRRYLAVAQADMEAGAEDGHSERDLKWSIPANARVETPAGSQLVHDDRLISAALIAEVGRLYHQGIITIGRAESAVIPAEDPLANLEF